MGISLWKLLLTLLIIVILFGTKKLKDVGSDLAGAINNFRKSIRETDSPTEVQATVQAQIDHKKDAQVSKQPKG